VKVILLSEKTPIEKISSAIFEHAFPADLTLVVVCLVASIVAIYLPLLNATPLRIMLALPIILFIPGYCLIAALFPKNDDIDLIERMVLSIGLSIVVVPLIGLGLNFTSWGIRLNPIVISVTLFTLVMLLIAFYQRAHVPFEERFRFPFLEIGGTIRKEIFPSGGGMVERILSAILTLLILIAIITTIYVITVPREGERFTEFFILGENRTAADYPDEITVGQNYPIYVSVGNHEYRNITYTIETWMIRTEFDNVTNSSYIMTMDPIDQLSLTLPHNENTIIPYNISAKKPDYNRVDFLLFDEIVPGFNVTGDDRINASYRNLHLWVTVE
jgi:uncharacterized membrane protein